MQLNSPHSPIHTSTLFRHFFCTSAFYLTFILWWIHWTATCPRTCSGLEQMRIKPQSFPLVDELFYVLSRSQEPHGWLRNKCYHSYQSISSFSNVHWHFKSATGKHTKHSSNACQNHLGIFFHLFLWGDFMLFHLTSLTPHLLTSFFLPVSNFDYLHCYLFLFGLSFCLFAVSASLSFICSICAVTIYTRI